MDLSCPTAAGHRSFDMNSRTGAAEGDDPRKPRNAASEQRQPHGFGHSDLKLLTAAPVFTNMFPGYATVREPPGREGEEVRLAGTNTKRKCEEHMKVTRLYETTRRLARALRRVRTQSAKLRKQGRGIKQSRPAMTGTGAEDNSRGGVWRAMMEKRNPGFLLRKEIDLNARLGMTRGRLHSATMTSTAEKDGNTIVCAK
jgi:hypothetical protein